MLGAVTHRMVSIGSYTLLDLATGEVIHINVNPADPGVIRGKLDDKQIANLLKIQLKYESEMEKTVIKMLKE
jgi:hypothetical protein